MTTGRINQVAIFPAGPRSDQPLDIEVFFSSLATSSAYSCPVGQTHASCLETTFAANVTLLQHSVPLAHTRLTLPLEFSPVCASLAADRGCLNIHNHSANSFSVNVTHRVAVHTPSSFRPDNRLAYSNSYSRTSCGTLSPRRHSSSASPFPVRGTWHPSGRLSAFSVSRLTELLPRRSLALPQTPRSDPRAAQNPSSTTPACAGRLQAVPIITVDKCPPPTWCLNYTVASERTNQDFTQSVPAWVL